MASNKLRSAMAGDEGELAIDMSPMIDMVFLLLIFFLVNASMIIVEMDPNVKPPVASHAKEARQRLGRIVINIREDGTLFRREEQGPVQRGRGHLQLRRGGEEEDRPAGARAAAAPAR
jgi:biopolymer transport protein ExbD